MRIVKRYDHFIKESKMNENQKNSSYNAMIDYTLLAPNAGEEEIEALCEKAIKLGVKSVCILPKMVKKAAEELKDSSVLVCTVISFPEGTDSLSAKISETKKVLSDGADEVDMVLNYPLLSKFAQDAYIFDDLVEEVSELAELCHAKENKDGEPVILKVIVESGHLNQEETTLATEICMQAGADFIKTSTGKVEIGAEVDKVQTMKNTIEQAGSDMKIKASGGIRNIQDIEKFIPYVDRLGIGYNSVDVMNGLAGDESSSY
jgi:deoxyribose-phosphate aldolase